MQERNDPEVIGRRVARLPEQCGRVLGLASVFGRDFWLPALERLCGVGAGELLDVVRGKLKVVAFEDLFLPEPKPVVVQRICAIRPSQ